MGLPMGLKLVKFGAIGFQILRMHISETAGGVYTVRSSMDMMEWPRTVVVQRHDQLPIHPTCQISSRSSKELSRPVQCCWNTVARSPIATHESNGRPKVLPWMVRLATNEFFMFSKKKFWKKSGHTTPQMHWYHIHGLTQDCANHRQTRFGAYR